jgi:type I restriction enzyme, S subunit
MRWEVVELGQVIDIKHGYAFKSAFFADQGEYILLTPGNCHESGGLRLKGDNEKFYAGDFPSEYLLHEGDMLVVMTDLINRAPILGGSFLIPENNRFLHNQRLGLVQIADEQRIDKLFLYYLLNTYDYRAQVRGSASGATVRHTSPGRIKECKVRIPREVGYQRRIGETLLAYDELIENNRRRMALL